MPNEKLISILNEIREIADILGEVYKEKAYGKAIPEIKKLNFEITPANIELIKTRKIPGVGPGILGKIIEFVTTGVILELEKAKKSRKVQAFRVLSGIAGVGPATIKKWIDLGIDSLPKLRKAVASGKINLNTMQKYGLRYYADLNERMPHAEVAYLGEIVKSILLQIDPEMIFTICGSFRRNVSTSGDIDILVTNPHTFNDELLEIFMDIIDTDVNFIDYLSSGKERVTFLYKSPVSKKARQIDILNLPYGSYYAGVLYFTGSGEFNVYFRAYAKSKGYRLNQDGLYKYVGKRLVLVPTRSEREIFDILKLKYIPPHQRTDGRQVIPIV
ncbi:DNA polymerase family X [Pacmanvirus A23]|uniref:DNA polymerase family X n=1 Tax=Pacmanvirus A23 TaxID=1932881 RepID=UPI000A093E2A|nr:DNA polymerase family X [Pacmanvirus A23]SIP86133.1 DNA polymerase family X [Pacmanvirus A23]